MIYSSVFQEGYQVGFDHQLLNGVINSRRLDALSIKHHVDPPLTLHRDLLQPHKSGFTASLGTQATLLPSIAGVTSWIRGRAARHGTRVKVKQVSAPC